VVSPRGGYKRRFEDEDDDEDEYDWLRQKQQCQAENHKTDKEGHYCESHYSAETDAGYGQNR
jgi:hypothetical protein